jgi:hypothetical protein
MAYRFSYELISSTTDVQTSKDAAVSDIIFKASPLCITNFAPPSRTCNADPGTIGADLTK